MAKEIKISTDKDSLHFDGLLGILKQGGNGGMTMHQVIERYKAIQAVEKFAGQSSIIVEDAVHQTILQAFEQANFIIANEASYSLIMAVRDAPSCSIKKADEVLQPKSEEGTSEPVQDAA